MGRVHDAAPRGASHCPHSHPGESGVLIAVQAAGVEPIDNKIKLGEFTLILPVKAPFLLGRPTLPARALGADEIIDAA